MLVSKEISNNGTSWLDLDLGSSQVKLIVKPSTPVEELNKKILVLFFMNNATIKV